MLYESYQNMIEKFNGDFGINAPRGKTVLALDERNVKDFIKSQAIQSIDDEIERLKSTEWDGKEWIEMVNASKAAGFSKILSPEDFISGKNQAIKDQISHLEEQKKLIQDS